MTLSSLLSKLAQGHHASPIASPTLSPHASRHSSFSAPQRTPSLTTRPPARPFTPTPLLPPLHDSLHTPLDSAPHHHHPTTHVSPAAVSHRLLATRHAPPTPTWADLAYAHAAPAPTTPPLGLAGSSLPPHSPFASITRVLFTAQPSTFLRTFGRRTTAPGPASVLVALFALLATAAAAVRTWLVQKARCCRTCRGYGVLRCRVCDGAGRVDWQAKFGHQTCCPLCFNKRLMSCPDCGGFHHRPIFKHRPAGAGGPIEFKDAYTNDIS